MTETIRESITKIIPFLEMAERQGKVSVIKSEFHDRPFPRAKMVVRFKKNRKVMYVSAYIK